MWSVFAGQASVGIKYVSANMGFESSWFVTSPPLLTYHIRTEVGRGLAGNGFVP